MGTTRYPWPKEMKAKIINQLPKHLAGTENTEQIKAKISELAAA